ncbi:RICIN domain-containing protein [Streptomyces shenzhenensis]|uniref:RICIN domain-containing protein n=1 Tax=Streptomyces shenzhenensis TaxID=943815 RepID=UPI002867FE98|nr:RICIN domain-containing protein [Streptomyces shenzhenensis]
MPPLRKPRPPAERSGTTTGRFSDTFARRPAVPRRGLVPGVRVWATVAAAAGLTVVVAAAVPLLSRVDLFPDPDTTPAAAVAAGEPTTLSSASGSPSPSSSKPSHAPSAHKPGKTGSGGSGSAGGTGSGSAGQQSGGGSVSSGSNSNSGSTSSGSKSGGSGSSSSGKSSSGTSSSGTSSSGTSSSGGSGTTTTTVPGVALIGTGSGRCIDVTNAGGDGTRLELLDCSGAAKQKWVFQSDGTIRSLGLCMDLAWGNTANGTAIQVAKCSGNRAQLFYLSAQGDLVSAQADKCVDATDSGTGNGTKLQLWTCSGTPNQKWHKG